MRDKLTAAHVWLFSAALLLVGGLGVYSHEPFPAAVAILCGGLGVRAGRKVWRGDA